ncbi:hypothetical protein [Candidatus Magnetomonas plexicatena]|uniref:hypothetical protein n=1 Tax=Candidatus Magnetomonas plexicatena TaxID=2552947 RepID=UPI001C75C338|nr:hypothetical protein E2O03_000410 [Nitrospirales bacterium LBB_01]
MIKLGDITLPNDLTWPNCFEWTGISETVERTLSGDVVIYGTEITGRTIDLTGGSDYGWITYKDLKTLLDMASVYEEIYEFEFNGDIYTVRFRHEDSPVLEFTPVTDTAEFIDDDYFYGVIKLMEV